MTPIQMTPESPPKFITFEGIEGSGKTTQVRRAAAFLEERGVRPVVTREPGSTDIGAKIRSILLDPAHRGLTPHAELLLYMADRAHHIARVIGPALEAGRVILCDRYVDATLAYQGYARGLDLHLLTELHRLALNDLMPDLTFLLDLAPEQGLARAWSAVASGDRGKGETRFEEEALSFHRRVREGYLDLARKAPDRFCVIDASRDEAAVRWAVRDVLERRVLSLR